MLPSVPDPIRRSIGWNPVFNRLLDREKSAEPWLLHDFAGADFCGQEIRLIACAFIRPEVLPPRPPPAACPGCHALLAQPHATPSAPVTLPPSLPRLAPSVPRMQADFVSVQALVERIHRDAEVTREALQHEAYAQWRSDPFLLPA